MTVCRYCCVDLFDTKKLLAGIGVVVSIGAIVCTVLVQQAAVAELDRRLGDLGSSLPGAPAWTGLPEPPAAEPPAAVEPATPTIPEFSTPAGPNYTAPAVPQYSAPTPEAYTPPAPPMPEPSTHTVRYEVISDSGASTVTYTADGNDSIGQERNVGANWATTVTMESTYGYLHTSVSGQNAGSATISCRISVDGEVVKEVSSHGQYAIASCAH